MTFSLPRFDAFAQVFATNPSLAIMQLCMIAAGVTLVYLVLFTTRDVLLRTKSLWVQLLSIVAVAALPVAGFLLYLLVRPSTTTRQRQFEHDMRESMKRISAIQSHKKHHHHQQRQQLQQKQHSVTRRLVAGHSTTA